MEGGLYAPDGNNPDESGTPVALLEELTTLVQRTDEVGRSGKKPQFSALKKTFGDSRPVLEQAELLIRPSKEILIPDYIDRHLDNGIHRGSLAYHVIEPIKTCLNGVKNLLHKEEDVSAHIRWMIHRDLPQVLDIERASFEYHWTEADFLHCLQQRNCIGMVAESTMGAGDIALITGF